MSRFSLPAWCVSLVVAGLLTLCAAPAAAQDDLLIWLPSAISGHIPSRLPDTGITTCTNSTMVIACPGEGAPFHGQDAQYNPAARQRAFTLIANGDEENTLVDTVSGLEWMRDDSVVLMFWQDAVNYCDGLTWNENTDWRLPSYQEVFGLADQGLANPALDAIFYGNSGVYWTTTTAAANPLAAWALYVTYGQMQTELKDQTMAYARCVRDGAPAVGAYRDNNDGTVSDLRGGQEATGLIWTQADAGTGQTWQEALATCENLTLDNRTDWRLPDVHELQSLVDPERSNPSVDPLFAAQSIPYWSSSHFGTTPSSAWYVRFSDGAAFWGPKTATLSVRCVRGGQQ